MTSREWKRFCGGNCGFGLFEELVPALVVDAEVESIELDEYVTEAGVTLERRQLVLQHDLYSSGQNRQ